MRPKPGIGGPETTTAGVLPENVRAIVTAILDKNPLHNDFMGAALENIRAEELEHLSKYLAFCHGRGLSNTYLADCYLTIVRDTIREQIYFQRHKKYRYSTFAEVAQSVYFDPEYMSRYMYGLALTSFLWSNHLAMFRFFRETLPNDKKGSYVEIGPGHGYFFTTAMQAAAYDHFLGVDISETSIKQTQALIQHFSDSRPMTFELRCLDFLQSGLPEGAFDAVVMGEVLEHVERPELFMQQIARIAKERAHIFITTCINAPAVDHICLFKHPDELDRLFDECGLHIQRQLICPYEGTTLEDSLARRLAVNVAYVLAKK
jgi:2-polyprenyl-3-methyl-5-hydroxy-6-metoxy-1,4-benzoquinol methylase